MRLVVDSNILFTYFWSDSVARKLFSKQSLVLIAPEYALTEVNKYSEGIIKKTGIKVDEFKELRIELATMVSFIAEEEYKDKLQKALKICPDPSDIDFFALALKADCPLWSNDKLLKQQSDVRVLSTHELFIDSDFIEAITD
jgi:predicted nucleic acid-binding protein